MTAAFHRKRRQAVGHLLRAKLRSDDTAEQRADNLIRMLGLAGDPAVIAEHRRNAAEVLRDYQSLDEAVRTHGKPHQAARG